MSDAGRAPDTNGRVIRSLDQRVTSVQQGGPQRVNGWVIGTDPDTGELIASSPDRTHVLTPPPPSDGDITAGIMPGVFQASRLATPTEDATAAGAFFPDGWYDNVEWSSDRLEFDQVTSEVLIQSTALLLINIVQRVAAVSGTRTWRAQLSRKRGDEEDFTLVRQTPNSYQSTNSLVFGGLMMLPAIAGDVIKPGYHCSESIINTLTGEATATMTRFEIARVIDL